LRLLAGDVGKTVVSCAALALLFLLLSGVYLWWPFKRATIAWSAPARRLWFDVHSTVGIVAFAFLLVLTVTGLVIGFDEKTTPFFYRITSSRPVEATFRTALGRGAARVTPAHAIAIARAALPGAAPIAMNRPGPTAVYVVRLRYPEDLTPGGRSRVYIDPESGIVLQAESSRTTAAGQRIVIANRANHTGDIFGFPSKTIMSLASLVAVVQLASGVMLWWKRR